MQRNLLTTARLLPPAGRGLRHAPVNPGPVQPMRMPPGLAGHSPARGPGGGMAGRPGMAVGTSPGGRVASREEVVARLQSLSKEELDSFEAALRAQKAAQMQQQQAVGMGMDGRPGGMRSSSPGR